MNVLAICCTKGRHTHLEKAVKCFIDQDYKGLSTLLIYNNSNVSQYLYNILLPQNKQILLINRHTSLYDNTSYTSYGQAQNDALKLAPNSDAVTHMDDDDIYLPNHISEGVKGLIRGGKKAYKPKYSYYRGQNGIELQSNVMEPSIFVKRDYLDAHGYSNTNADSHLQWVNPLVNNNDIFIDEKGVPTFIYDWSGEIPVWKISGDDANSENFNNHNKTSQDHGDGIITPIPTENIQQYYNLIKK